MKKELDNFLIFLRINFFSMRGPKFGLAFFRLYSSELIGAFNTNLYAPTAEKQQNKWRVRVNLFCKHGFQINYSRWITTIL